MKVKFFATYRDITRRKDEDVPAPADVWELLLDLAERYNGFGKELLTPDKADVNDEAIVLVNGRNIAHLAGKSTELTEVDVVSLFPMVAGG
jgi:MoaD family protein